MPPDAKPRLRIGLVNNMPDAALITTERQFARVLGPEAELELFHFPEVERGEAMRERLQQRYRPLSELEHARLDGLIVTGTEPRASDLRQEPYWKSFAWLVDWASENTTSTVWSCLAAHAAVLHLHGVPRHRLERKCSGVFARSFVADDPLMAGIPTGSPVPHSRHNTLDEAELAEAGYRVLARVGAAGVDMFALEGPSRFVFLQGHPEYDADSLALEFQRDFNRYHRGISANPPHAPYGVFDAELEKAVAALIAAHPAPDPAAPRGLGSLVGGASLRRSWRPSAEQLYANWRESLMPAPLASAPRPSLQAAQP